MNSNYVNWCGEKNVAKEPQTMVYQTLRQYFPDIRIERKQETDGPKRGQTPEAGRQNIRRERR